MFFLNANILGKRKKEAKAGEGRKKATNQTTKQREKDRGVEGVEMRKERLK